MAPSRDAEDAAKPPLTVTLPAPPLAALPAGECKEEEEPAMVNYKWRLYTFLAMNKENGGGVGSDCASVNLRLGPTESIIVSTTR
jgi:hypothetical protein